MVATSQVVTSRELPAAPAAESAPASAPAPARVEKGVPSCRGIKRRARLVSCVLAFVMLSVGRVRPGVAPAAAAIAPAAAPAAVRAADAVPAIAACVVVLVVLLLLGRGVGSRL